MEQQEREPSSSLARILFGSCNSQIREQPLWDSIIARNASAFVWSGDAVYAKYSRSGITYDKRAYMLAPKHRPGLTTPETLRQAFDEQLQRDGYQRFLQTGIDLFGTWDDHDYGDNDSDETNLWNLG